MTLESEPVITWEQLQLALRSGGDLGLGELKLEFLRGSLEAGCYVTQIALDLIEMVMKCSLARSGCRL